MPAAICWLLRLSCLEWYVRFQSGTWGLQGEICDIDGTCVDAADDEIFKLTTKGGSLSMEREKVMLHSCTTASWGTSCTCCLHLVACTVQCLAGQICMP